MLRESGLAGFTLLVAYAAVGKSFAVEATLTPIGQGSMRFSFWILGGMFALLGAAVVLRRPDLYAAKVFVVFAGLTSVALAVAPSSGGPAPQWALIVQVLSVLGVGGSFFIFANALMQEESTRRRSATAWLFVGMGLVLATAYAGSVLIAPQMYAVVRPLSFLSVSAAILAAVVLLAKRSTKDPMPLRRQQARIVLWGTAISAVPFVALTLIPEALGGGTLVPVHLSVLGWGLMPIFFAYAILQHQLLGIRRLVHRGMVYGIATLGIFTVIVVGLAVVLPLTGNASSDRLPTIALAGFLVGGIILFFPMRRASRLLVHRFMYGGVVDYQAVLGVVQENLVGPEGISHVASGITDRLAQALRLESALLFLGADLDQSQLAARPRNTVGECLGV